MKSRIDRNIFARGAEPAPAEQQQSVRSTSVSSGVLQEIEGLLEDIRAGKLTSRADARGASGTDRDILRAVNEMLDAVLAPLNTAGSHFERISHGEIPSKIQDNWNGDFNSIKSAINLCIDSLDGLSGEVRRMSQEHERGDIDVVITAEKFQGEYRAMAQGINEMVNAHITVKKKAMACISEFGKGNFDAELEKFPGKKAFINDTIEGLRKNLKEFVAEVHHMSDEHDKGDIDVVIPAERFMGGFRTMSEGVNRMVFGHITVKKKAMACIKEFGEGNFEAPLEKFPGKKAFINETIEQVRANLKALIADAGLLAKAAVEGKLATRADASKHNGDFRKIVQGVNDCLDAVIGPLNVAANYVDKISKGEIPPVITDNYNGDFNTIKNNLNTMVVMMSDLLSETDIIIKAAANGELDTRADAAKFVGGWNKLVSGVNDTITNIVNPLNVTADYVDKVARGIIPPEITTEYKGQYNIIKNNLNSMVRMMSDLLAETDIIIKAAANGELDTRADAAKFVGGWNKLVSGVNDTITNIVNPLNVTADYVDKVAKGIIPPVITTEYKGQYNIIKNNLNGMVAMMSELLSETDKLVKAAIGGQLATRADAGQFVGGWNQLVDGVNKTLDAVIGPLNVAANYVDRISKGDIPQRITDNYNGDFNQIKNNLNVLIDAMNEVTAMAQSIASGDLKVVVEKRSKNDELMIALDRMVKELTAIAVSVQSASDQVATGSQEISASAQEMSQGAAEQSASIEEVSSSMEEMSSTVAQNADNARQTAAIAEKAAIEAQDGGKSVSETVHAMKSIAEKISIIQEIASQTNMLSLNAAIEAGRAGEHGKGFAVVAAEVRKLAERSQAAAKEISSLSVHSVEIAERAGKLIENIVPGIQKTAELVQEINASSAEQSEGIKQVTKAVQQLDQVIQQNASATEEMASTSEELSSQAQQLKEAAGFFKVENSGRSQVSAAGPSHARVSAHTTHQTQHGFTSSKKFETKTAEKKGGVDLDMSDPDDAEFERY
ncbi:MAG TPA: methyl-accepting chemotaxis protein [Spirochaetota bacterium]|nr:methyl-accepting chemotaxis protein [Spirochaetota bacterium]HPN82138.1 methyl-accepting chemotaxis protein [Spirochaetota bacterium]